MRAVLMLAALGEEAESLDAASPLGEASESLEEEERFWRFDLVAACFSFTRRGVSIAVIVLYLHT
jgi:hypothetical protein